MDIYIKWDSDKKGFLLPINPEGFELSDSMNNTSIIVHNLGEINLKGKRSLWTITLESFFPHQKYSFSRGAYHDPYEYYIKKLKKLFEKNTTIHLIITQTSINGFFTIESFTYGNKEKNGDVSYSLSLKEFRAIKSSSVSVKKKKTTKKIYGGSGAAGAGSSSRVTKTPQTGVYVWKKGDTWQKVTKKCLGSSETWKITKQRNATVIKKANGYVYEVTELIENFDYKLTCETDGVAANANRGSLEPVDYIDDYKGGQLTDIFVAGTEDEDIESFRQKVLETFKATAFCGNKADYRKYVNAIQGVGGCKPKRREQGSPWINIYVISSDFKAPSDALIKEIQTAVDPVQSHGEGDGMVCISLPYTGVL